MTGEWVCIDAKPRFDQVAPPLVDGELYEIVSVAPNSIGEPTMLMMRSLVTNVETGPWSHVRFRSAAYGRVPRSAG